MTLAYVRACGGDTAAWEARWRAVAGEVDHSPPSGSGDAAMENGLAPYVGLAGFEPEDSDRFFGRDTLITRLVEKVSRQRLVAVVGASGSGKSSLLRAGLLPALRAPDLGGARWWPLLLSPGPHPVREFAARVGAELGLGAEQLAAELAEESGRLDLVVAQLAASLPAGVDLLLVVDQFEEIFTLCGDAEERDRFVAVLLAAAAGCGGTRVVLGLRADFLWPLRPLSHAGARVGGCPGSGGADEH